MEPVRRLYVIKILLVVREFKMIEKNYVFQTFNCGFLKTYHARLV